MRNAPKFLGPWERIDKMVDDRWAEAQAEIKLMADAARLALPVDPKRVQLDHFAMFQQLVASGMRAMTADEMSEMVRRQMEGLRPATRQDQMAGMSNMLYPQSWMY